MLRSHHTPSRYFKMCFTLLTLITVSLYLFPDVTSNPIWINENLIFSLLIPFAFFLISMNNANLFTQLQNPGTTFGLGLNPNIHTQALHVSLPSEASFLGWDKSVSDCISLYTLTIYRQQNQVV